MHGYPVVGQFIPEFFDFLILCQCGLGDAILGARAVATTREFHGRYLSPHQYGTKPYQKEMAPVLAEFDFHYG